MTTSVVFLIIYLLIVFRSHPHKKLIIYLVIMADILYSIAHWMFSWQYFQVHLTPSRSSRTKTNQEETSSLHKCRVRYIYSGSLPGVPGNGADQTAKRNLCIWRKQHFPVCILRLGYYNSALSRRSQDSGHHC
jgi:hypothetical protein